MPDQQRCDRYLEVLQRWMTPEEMDQLRKEMGPPADMVERSQRVDRIIARDEHKEAVWQFLKAAALAFASIVAALATIKALLPAGWLP